MKSKGLHWFSGSLGFFFILTSLVITFLEFNQFNSQSATFPAGSRLADIPVGGLDETAAAARLSEFYAQPLALHIHASTLHADPSDLGFTFDIHHLIEEAVLQLDTGTFWDYLWNRPPKNPVVLPLDASVDQSQIRHYLNSEIVPRYIQSGHPITPIPGTTNFTAQIKGEQLVIEQAVTDITEALLSPTIHDVLLQTHEEADQAPSLEMLQAFLEHNIALSGFDQLVEIYLSPMETGDVLHFAVRQGTPLEPGVAFTAASTMKIPIMISVFRRVAEPTPDAVIALMRDMIVNSENPPADTLMSTYLDEIRGPLIVTEDLFQLGMENTFLGGYFYPGAPVLQVFNTPANQRTDIDLDPDNYSQTIPAEAGQLLSAIYSCAKENSGLLVDTFSDEITQAECQLMIDFLSGNQIGILIEAGLPPEGLAAHKHGYATELDGLLHAMSDAAIVFTPGDDYVLTIFIHDPARLDFDAGNQLIARLSQTVYNFFNNPDQAYWWFN